MMGQVVQPDKLRRVIVEPAAELIGLARSGEGGRWVGNLASGFFS